ncbi:glycerol kinase 1 [Spirochaetia bacterium]|nr:glycerol kinase 1 [Spirochaetia bacterium]
MAASSIIAIDQSTSATKALLFDSSGNVAAMANREHKQKISTNGWVSHDPMEIYHNTIAVIQELIEKSGIVKTDIAAVGISNQRETALVWDAVTGKPVNDAVVWQCNRGEKICEKLSLYSDDIRQRTGLPLSPYFSAAKIAWLLENLNTRKTGKLCAGTIDTWLVYKLTGNFKTDFSNAARTQLMNIHNLVWDEKICGYFGIDPVLLPEICASDSCFGYTDFEGLLPHPVPVHGVLGDSNGALFAQGCLESGMAKATYGTGTSVMVNIGHKPVLCKNVVTSIAWILGGEITYVVEGNINYSGAVIKWLVDDVKLISSAREAGALAASANLADTAYLVPAFSGLGCPHWAPEARACLCGMSRTTGRAEIVRAAEESIAWQIRDVVESIQEEAGVHLRELRADGGASRDTFLMQFQSDILNLPLSVPANGECSAAGAAWVAGIALGIYDRHIWNRMAHTVYSPAMDETERGRRRRGWKDAVRMVTVNGSPADSECYRWRSVSGTV